MNLIVALIGLCLYFLYRKELNLIFVKKIFFYIFVFCSLLLISKTHEDFIGYHIQSINDIFYNNLTFGIANYDINTAHTSLLSYAQVLYILPYFGSKLLHIPSFLIFFSTVGYFYIVFQKLTKNKLEIFFSLFVFFVLIVKFTRLSEYGYDYISQFILLIVFHKVFFQSNQKEEVCKSLLFFAFTVCIKIISLVSFPILFLILNKKLFKNFSFKFIFLLLIFGSILSFNSFVRTGCIFYPVNITCFDKDSISWSVKKEIKNHSEFVELWAKGFYGPYKSTIAPEENKYKYLSNFNWVKYWVHDHFFYKISEYLLILTFVYFLLFFSFKQKILSFNFNKDIIKAILASGFATYLWFITAPQFRFGFANITILFFFLINFFFNTHINLKTKPFIYLLIVLLLFFNIKNFLRIKNEFSRLDMYQYKSFPWINQSILETKNFRKK